MADADFAKGATAGPGYDTTPGGLGLSPAYLGGATATASLSASSTSGTSFPSTPADGQEYVYVADATNGIFWKFRWYATSSYWAFVGGAPLYSVIATQEATTSTAFTALATPGPIVALPFAGDYDVEIGFAGSIPAIAGVDELIMSYKIGASAASTADACYDSSQAGAGVSSSVGWPQRKTSLAAVSLTAQYATKNGGSLTFGSRWMKVTPVKK